MIIEPTVLITFIIATAALLVVPGPTIIMVVTQVLSHGNKVAPAAIAGVALGDLFAAGLSIAGVGAVLATSAAAFTAIKFIGAAYLIYIGVKMWRAPVAPLEINSRASGAGKSGSVFRDAFLVTLFNPKGIIFFVAFVPQFMMADRPFAPQAAVLVAVFVLLGILNAAGYALLAGSIRHWLAQPNVLRAATRLGASFLVSAGFAALLARRAT